MIFMAAALAMATSAFAAPQPFAEGWLEQLRQDARRSGVSEKTIKDKLYNISPMNKFPDRNEQAEFRPKDTLDDYLRPRVTTKNIAKGRAFMEQYADDLHKLEKKYGVSPQYIMAIWALETRFGGYTGKEDVITSLVTLARDHANVKKRDYFRSEAIAALKLIDAGYDEVRGKGSWAGAMGQPQFMPSNVEKYAIDLNGDGKKDIWNDKREVFASISNYLAKSRLGGWQAGQRWGREVKLPPGFNKKMLTNKLANQTLKTPNGWKKLGVKQANGNALPREDKMKGMLIAPDGIHGRIFLVYNNFKSVMGYNSSYKYALSVSLLADAIASRPPQPAPAPGLN